MRASNTGYFIILSGCYEIADSRHCDPWSRALLTYELTAKASIFSSDVCASQGALIELLCKGQLQEILLCVVGLMW